jgi:hypothetical protein
MIRRAVDEEIPRDLAWLQGYDLAFSKLDSEFDLPQKDRSLIGVRLDIYGIDRV